MNKSLITLHFGAAILLVTSQAALAEPQIGTVVQREYLGAVAEPNGSQDDHPIGFKDAVFALDTVKTGTGTTALEFLDQTTVQIGAGAQLRLDDFVYDPATTVGGGKISFAVGAFRYVGGKMTTEQNISLQTPTATMVIRGTELVIYVWPDGRTEINVMSGAVAVSPCAGGKNGQMAMTGMQVTIMPTCAMHLAAAPALPAGMAALELPERHESGPDDDGDDSSRDPGGSRGGGSGGGAGGASGGGSRGGGAGIR